MLELIISLIAGALGGNIAGALFKSINMGTLVNSIAGIVGGGLGGQIIAAILGGAGTVATGDATAATGALDIGAIIGQIAGGGVGGGVLLAIVSLLKNAMSRT